MAPNDLLKHDVIEHAAAAGLAALRAGRRLPARRRDLPLQAGLRPDGVVPFIAVQLVPDQSMYRHACAAVATSDQTFFPRYRAPVVAG